MYKQQKIKAPEATLVHLTLGGTDNFQTKDSMGENLNTNVCWEIRASTTKLQSEEDIQFLLQTIERDFQRTWNRRIRKTYKR